MSRYEFHKVIMGYILIGVWGTLIALIALGKVEQSTSYGLDMCIVALTGISTLWAKYMFDERRQPKDDGEDHNVDVRANDRPDAQPHG